MDRRAEAVLSTLLRSVPPESDAAARITAITQAFEAPSRPVKPPKSDGGRGIAQEPGGKEDPHGQSR